MSLGSEVMLYLSISSSESDFIYHSRNLCGYLFVHQPGRASMIWQVNRQGRREGKTLSSQSLRRSCEL